MAYPTKYTRQYDFQSYQNANPNRPLPADKVNADLNAIANADAEVVEFLKLFTRSDGKIANASIGFDQLTADVKAYFGDIGLGGNLRALDALEGEGLVRRSNADGGSFTAGAVVSVSEGGTSSDNEADARVALGVEIDVDVQAYSVNLDTFAGIAPGAAAIELLDDDTIEAMRTTLGLGTAAQSAATDFATAAQGALADTATQPGDLGDLAAKDLVAVPGDLDVTGTPDGSKFLRDDGSWQSIPGGGDMLSTNNLSDVASAATAFGNIKQAASDSASGVVELATSAEVATGTDTARAVTPAGAAAVYSGITRGMSPQSGTTYTLVLSDAGKFVYTTSASAVTITVPPNSDVAFPIGAQVDIAQGGTGKVTVSPGSGVTLASANNLKSISTTYAAATLIKTATDTWLLMGALTS